MQHGLAAMKVTHALAAIKVIPIEADRTKRSSRACVVCRPAERKRLQALMGDDHVPHRCGRESSYECKECNVALCVDPCFKIYYTYKDHDQAYNRWRNEQDAAVLALM